MTAQRTDYSDFETLSGAEAIYIYELNTYTLLLAEALKAAGYPVAGFVQQTGEGSALQTSGLVILGFDRFARFWCPEKMPLLYSDNMVQNSAAARQHIAYMGIRNYIDPYAFMKPYMDASEWTYIAKALRYYGDPARSIFYDIGANRGGATDIALGHYREIVGIEANPAMQKYYGQRFEHDSRVQLVSCAVGSEQQVGVQPFFLDVSDNAGGSSLHAEYTKRHKVNELSEIEVRVETLAAICASVNLYPDFIKIDVEGSEPEVLLASLALIKEKQPILLFECWSDSWDKGVRDLTAALMDLGYTVYSSILGGQIWDFFEHGYAYDYVTNALCLPAGRSLPADLFPAFDRAFDGAGQ